MEKKTSILIIDDDPGICESLSDIFTQKGYLVFIANKGSEAIDKLKQNYFNVALIDIKLPDISGTELLKELIKINPEIICMIITGHASVKNAVNALEQGATAYITKPLDIDDLLHRIEDVLDRQRLKQELKESEENYRTVFENTGTATLIVEEDTVISMVNTQFEKLSGYSKEEIENKIKWSDFVMPQDLKRMKKYHIARRKAGEKAPTEYEFSFIDKKGVIKKIFLKVGIIPGTKKSIASLIDITERKQAEERLKKTMDATIQTMSKMIEAKDPYTSGHQQRVSQLATAIAKELNLPQNKVEGIRIASLIHDIGKIGLPTEILSKPSTLTDIEFSLIKGHSQIGYDILKSINFPFPIAQIVLQHHERINGSGYPNNLKGNEILLKAKIIGVSDVVEAMSSFRPYRPALGIDVALEEISQNRGILYDSEVVDACLKLFKEKEFKFKLSLKKYL